MYKNVKETVVMAEFINVSISEDTITISFDAGSPEIMTLGRKMNDICEEAYMNGYNWAAFVEYYLKENRPDILDIIESDPEAETYYALINGADSEANGLAHGFTKILEQLLSDEEATLTFLEDNMDNIEWE